MCLNSGQGSVWSRQTAKASTQAACGPQASCVRMCQHACSAGLNMQLNVVFAHPVRVAMMHLSPDMILCVLVHVQQHAPGVDSHMHSCPGTSACAASKQLPQRLVRLKSLAAQAVCLHCHSSHLCRHALPIGCVPAEHCGSRPRLWCWPACTTAHCPDLQIEACTQRTTSTACRSLSEQNSAGHQAVCCHCGQ